MPIQSVNVSPLTVMPSAVRTPAPLTPPVAGSTGVANKPRELGVEEVQAAANAPTGDAILKALDEVREAVKPVAQSLHFSLDKDTGRTVITVMDTETNELIRQIPSEEILKIAKAIDKLQGLLIKQQA